MYLIELFLPVYDNNKEPFEQAAFDRVRNELAEKFGGVTAFRRTPAEGLWKEDGGAVNRDEIVIFEVMAEGLDRAWWSHYRSGLEEEFRQQELIMRATKIEQL
jgi:hypothetical protein